MKWEEYNKAQSEIAYNNYLEGTNVTISLEYHNLKMELEKAWNETKDEVENMKCGSREKYCEDIIFGSKVYEIFSKEPYKIGIREASNDNFWRYIQISVVPNIIKERWGDNPDRFYALSRRLYLRIIWWFVFLAYDGTLEKTKKLLLSENFTSNTLAGIVERSGQNGYRFEVINSFIKKMSELNVPDSEFRKLAVLNSARLKAVNPYLYDGGINKYNEDLINEIRNK